MRAYGDPAGRGSRIEYQPALDGLRAIAVALVVVFHLDLAVGGSTAVRAGYLGVSVFFTLSGFLITRLLLAEHAETGSISLSDFYRRRLRRLMPASWVTIAAVAIAATFGVFAASERLRGDLVASALQALNLREMFSDSSYDQLFADPSPVAHFWSLGVEEQFYWLWPPVVAFALSRRVARRTVVVAFAVTAIATPLTVQIWSADLAYYAPWTRVAEILAGAVVAVWVTRRGVPTGAARLAAPALTVIVVISVVAPTGVDPVVVSLLPVVAVVSALAVLGLLSDGRTTRALSIRPLVALGRISYGVYLVHWPVFVALSPSRFDVSPITLAAARLAVTLALSVLLYRLVERPLRHAPLPARPRVLALSLAAGTAVVVGAVVVSVDARPTATAAPTVLSWTPDPAGSSDDDAPPPPPTTGPAPGSTAWPDGLSAVPRTDPIVGWPSVDAGADAEKNPDPAEPSPSAQAAIAAALDAPPAAADPHVVGLFGDSVAAWLLRDGASSLDLHDLTVVNATMAGCDGAVDVPDVRDRRNQVLAKPDDCHDWPVWYPSVIEAAGGRLDTAVLVLGQAVVLDRRVDGEWAHPCDAIEWYVDDVERRVEWLRSADAHVVFALPSRLGRNARFIVPDDADRRVNCVRTALRDRMIDLEVDLIDLAPLFCPAGSCDAIRRGDGIHVDADHAGPVLVDLVEQARRTHPDQR
ncbi:MAG: acyltransferase family protein [Actinomycetota bacterium]